MIDAYAVYLDCLDKVNKEENGYFKVDLFNRLAWNASRHVFNDYQARLQNPNTAKDEKQKLLDRLFPFIEHREIAVTNGYTEQPDDYAYFSNAKGYYDNGDTIIELNALYAQLCEAENDPSINKQLIQEKIDQVSNNPKFVGIQLLDNEQVARRLNSYVPGKRPSYKKPIMEREGGRFHLYPEGSASMSLWYYRRPVPANLVMKDVPATGELQYDPDNSTGFEWTEEGINDVIAKIILDFAIWVRERDLYQMADSQKTP
jgi:hypothetical protein